MTQEASKGSSCDSAKRGSFGLGIRVCGYEEFSSSSVCALDLLSTNMAEEDNWGTWSAASPPGVAAPTMPATSAPTMPAEAAVESVLFRKNPSP